jgi:hypothetical protein
MPHSLSSFFIRRSSGIREEQATLIALRWGCKRIISTSFRTSGAQNSLLDRSVRVGLSERVGTCGKTSKVAGHGLGLFVLTKTFAVYVG